jgi:hypothetical protein
LFSIVKVPLDPRALNTYFFGSPVETVTAEYSPGFGVAGTAAGIVGSIV